jgi:hypothetical protein
MIYLIQAGSTNPGSNPQEEEMSMVNFLRQSVLECLIHILQALQNNNQVIINFFGRILIMIKIMDNVYPSEKVNYLSICVIEEMMAVCPHSAISNMITNRELIEKLLKKNGNKEYLEVSQRILKRIQIST